MRSRLVRLAAIALLLGPLLVMQAEHARACECEEMPAAYQLDYVDAAFSGRVIAVHDDGSYVEIEVYRVWKGAPYATRFLGRGEGDMCSEWWRFAEGREYLIYAYDGDAGALPTTSVCDVVELLHVEDELHVLGPGQAPEPGTVAPRPGEASPPGVGETGTGTVARLCEADGGAAVLFAVVAVVLAGARFATIFRRRARRT
ncbi:MAG: hypothetical protein F4Z07_11610 [Dehalococcoidia bacterium]|nr:hypothetical protein [Dehalococcoidia bacterium]